MTNGYSIKLSNVTEKTMRLTKSFLIMSVLLLLAAPTVKAQGGEAAVPFLLLAPDARFGALGESGTGLADNSSGIFWNPAGIAFLTGSEFGFTHSNWLPQFNLDLFYDYATYRQYIEDINGSVTASITYMDYGEFARTGEEGPTVLGTFNSFDMAVTVGYATKLSSDWGIGTNFRLIHSNLADKPTAEEQGSGKATTVSFDIAGMWRPTSLVVPFTDYDMGNKLSIGMNLSNLGQKIFYIDQAQADPIPTNLRLGFAYQVFGDDISSLTYTLDFSKLLVNRDSTGKSDEVTRALFTTWSAKPFNEVMADIVTTMGLEYVYAPTGDFNFAVRGGYFYEDPSRGNRKFITLGAGIKYDIYGFDFSYISTSVFKDRENHPLSETLRFTVNVGWGGIPDKVKGLPRGV